jgi:hypothetical protein
MEGERQTVEDGERPRQRGGRRELVHFAFLTSQGKRDSTYALSLFEAGSHRVAQIGLKLEILVLGLQVCATSPVITSILWIRKLRLSCPKTCSTDRVGLVPREGHFLAQACNDFSRERGQQQRSQGDKG